MPEFSHFASLLRRHLELDLAGATPQSLLVDDLSFDSLTMAEVVVFLDRCGVVLPDALIPELRTLGDLHHYCSVLAPAAPASGEAAPASAVTINHPFDDQIDPNGTAPVVTQ